MKVLWITNILFPEANAQLSGGSVLKSSGGWMLGAANSLLRQGQDIQLVVASVSHLVKELRIIKGESIMYYAIPYGNGNIIENDEYIDYWRTIQEKERPDIVHLHGTEFSHGLAFLKAFPEYKTVASIQGLTSVYAGYFGHGLENMTLIESIILDAQKRKFRKRGDVEIKTIKLVKHLIGRTSWDRAHCWAINRDAKYYFCNETLRPEFYDGSKWDYENCDKHTLFLSQVKSPIKGVHMLIKALPLVLKEFPDSKVRIAGTVFANTGSTIGNYIKNSGYPNLIKRMISQIGAEYKITFLGNLSAEEMKREYLNCNAFICPSVIENSPNSLGEAQILGTPHICAYVGGAMDMMRGNEDNLYRYDEYAMLAEKICNLFVSKSEQVDMSRMAMNRHNAEINAQQLLSIYRTILSHG